MILDIERIQINRDKAHARHEIRDLKEKIADKIARLQSEWEQEVGPIEVPDYMHNISHDY